ncbi:BON domain-containing protein [Pedobacter cryotolerans]|nr:BON domain-containing protein [Pedobacter cryotolerans]
MKIMKSMAFMALIFSVLFTGCKPKDADIKTAVEKSISAVPSLAGTTVEVKEGVVSLSGQLPDETAKSLAETTAKAVKGVKSVVNNLSIAAPITIAVDEVLTKSVKDAVKDYPTVVAAINDGVVLLTGEIKKDALPKLMMALSSLKPKKIENKLTVK